MKTFKKIVLSTSLIMMALGLLMSMVCLLAGGFRQLSKATFDGAKIMGDDLWSLIQEYGCEFEDVFGVNPEIHFSDDFCLYDDEREVLSGDFTDLEIAEKAAIQRLDIEVAASEVVIEQAEGDYFGIKAVDARKFQYLTEGDKLKVKVGDSTFKLGVGNLSEKITIYVPVGMEFAQITMSVGAGSLQSDASISTSDFVVSIGAGEVILEGLDADAASVDIGAGSCKIKKVEFGNTEFNVGAGEINYSGKLTGDTDVSCAMGSIQMDVSGKEDDYDYNIESTVGSVSVGSSSYSGLGLSKKIRNESENKINVSCAMGEVDIDFEE